MSLDGEKIRLLFDFLFVSVAFIDPKISSFYQCSRPPLVSNDRSYACVKLQSDALCRVISRYLAVRENWPSSARLSWLMNRLGKEACFHLLE